MTFEQHLCISLWTLYTTPDYMWKIPLQHLLKRSRLTFLGIKVENQLNIGFSNVPCIVTQILLGVLKRVFSCRTTNYYWSLTFYGASGNSPGVSICAFAMFILSGYQSTLPLKYLTIGRRVLSGGGPSFAFQCIKMDLILLFVISPLGSLALAFMVVLVN